jgi:hypothetical protein
MNNGLNKEVKEYRTAIAVAKEMLKKRIISQDDYAVICTVLTEEFGLKTSTIFSDYDLICTEKDGNMRH